MSIAGDIHRVKIRIMIKFRSHRVQDYDLEKARVASDPPRSSRKVVETEIKTFRCSFFLLGLRDVYTEADAKSSCAMVKSTGSNQI